MNTEAVSEHGDAAAEHADGAPPREDVPVLLGRPLSRRRGRVLAALGGLVLFAAFQPVGWWPLAFIGPALLFVALKGRSAKTAFSYGFTFGITLFAPLIFWLSNLGWAPYVGLTLAESAFFGLLTMPLPALLRRRAWPLWAAAWWIAVEAVRGREPLGGFPWGRLAFSQADSPALGWAAVAGAPGLGLVVVLVPVALAWLVLADGPRARRGAAGMLAGAVGLVAAGPLFLPERTGGGQEVTVAAVQGNVPRARNLEEQTRVRNVTENHVAATRQLAADVRAGRVPQPDLVLWPENATDSDPRADSYLGGIIAQAVEDIDAPVLVGAILDGPGERPYNAGLMWRPSGTPDAGPGEWYAKRHLVPFGEYIPMRDVLGGLGDLQLIPRDFRPGPEKPQIFRTGPIVLADTICYEVGYDGNVRSTVAPGANLMVVQTNNATYERGVQAGQSQQQLDMARVRAVEHDRATVVVSTVGISAIVAPDGSIMAKSGLWQPDVLVGTVPLRDGTTLADRVGFWPELAVCLIAAYGVLSGVRWDRVAARMRRRARTPVG